MAVNFQKKQDPNFVVKVAAEALANGKLVLSGTPYDGAYTQIGTTHLWESSTHILTPVQTENNLYDHTVTIQFHATPKSQPVGDKPAVQKFLHNADLAEIEKKALDNVLLGKPGFANKLYEAICTAYAEPAYTHETKIQISGPPKTFVTGKTEAEITLTFTHAHGFKPGDIVVVSGAPPVTGLNGHYAVEAPDGLGSVVNFVSMDKGTTLVPGTMTALDFPQYSLSFQCKVIKIDALTQPAFLFPFERALEVMNKTGPTFKSLLSTWEQTFIKDFIDKKIKKITVKQEFYLNKIEEKVAKALGGEGFSHSGTHTGKMTGGQPNFQNIPKKAAMPADVEAEANAENEAITGEEAAALFKNSALASAKLKVAGGHLENVFA